MSDPVGNHSYPSSLPGLLPWQSYLLAFCLGIAMFRFPLPAMTALTVLIVADTSLRGWLGRLPVLAFALCAVFGFGYAAQRAPDPVPAPPWMEERTPAIVDGVVDSVVPKPGGRLQLVLRDLRYALEDSAEGQRELPGKLVWNWRTPDRMPEPGQTVTGRLRVVQTRNFGNPGGFDYEWFWRRQGVFWRGWPAGKATVSWGDLPGNLMWELKQSLREAVKERVPPTQGGALVAALVTGDR